MTYVVTKYLGLYKHSNQHTPPMNLHKSEII